MKPTDHEIQVLEMLAGSRPWESGAWVNACFEFLHEGGFCTGRPPYRIKPKGLAFLADRRAA